MWWWWGGCPEDGSCQQVFIKTSRLEKSHHILRGSPEDSNLKVGHHSSLKSDFVGNCFTYIKEVYINQCFIANCTNCCRFLYASKVWEGVKKSSFFLEYSRLLP
jgi:hypothetical protein